MALVTLLFFYFSLISSFPKTSFSNSWLEDFDSSVKCFGDPTPTRNLNYQTNVSLFLSDLVHQANSQPTYPRFFNTSAGKLPNKIYGYYICWDDKLSPQKCRECVENRAQALLDRNWSPECFGLLGPGECMANFANNRTEYQEGYVLSDERIGGEVTNNQQEYNRTLTSTVDGLISEAALGNWSSPNFATRVVKVTGSEDKLYTLVQCTPDISAVNCSKCLGELYSYIPKCCNGTQGGMIIHANCFMKYNNQSFFHSASVGFMPNHFHVYLILLFSVGFLYSI